VRSRLLLVVPFLVAFEMFFRGPLERMLRGIPFPDVQNEFTTTQLWERFPGPLMGVLTFVVVGFLVVWWLGAKGFCTYGCPYGAFFGVVDRFAPGRIKVTDACDACGHCTSVCTSNVRVHEEVAIHKQIVDPACMKCMDCVSVCPKDALYYGFASPKPFRLSQQRIRARADFTWPEEIAMAVVAIGATLTYRGAWFGDGVPLLMAVGLGVITAVLALLGWRLLRRTDLAFQHTSLKVGGRFRTAGVAAIVGIVAWVVLTADTGLVQYQLWRATTMPIAGRDKPSERTADLRTMDGRLVFAQSVALVEDPRLAFRRGLALRELAVATADESGLDRAEEQLRRAIALSPKMVDAMVPLADLLNLRGELGEAEQLLRHAHEVKPKDPNVQFRLDAIERGRKR
jgi:Fe-S-cluster-containing hydrogenase component 2